MVMSIRQLIETKKKKFNNNPVTESGSEMIILINESVIKYLIFMFVGVCIR